MLCVSGSAQGQAASASNTNGILTKKIHRQDNSTSMPPTGGPSAAAIPLIADHLLTAAARRAAGTAAISSASELGINIAAPMACTTPGADQHDKGARKAAGG